MIVVREGRPEDADAIAEAHLQGWRVGYRGVVPDEHLDAPAFADSRRELWRAWTWNARGTSALFVAERDDRVVGFGLCGPERDQPQCDSQEAGAAAAPRGEVYAFYLHPDSWGSGAASALMSRCEEWLAAQCYREAVLWVLRDNPRGRRFYAKAGWTATGRETVLEGLPGADGLVEVEYATRL